MNVLETTMAGQMTREIEYDGSLHHTDAEVDIMLMTTEEIFAALEVVPSDELALAADSRHGYTF